MIQPLKHQTKGFETLLDIMSKESHCLEASGTGWGKTYVSLMVAREFGMRPAIICRKAMIEDWVEIADQVGVKPHFVANIEAAKSKNFDHGGWERKNKRYRWKLPADALMIFDEAHMLRNWKTGNSRMGIATKHQNLQTMFLTATPGSSPLDFYTFGRCFDFFDSPNAFFEWSKGYGCTDGDYSMEFVGMPEELDANMKALRKLIFPRYGHRVLWSEVPDAPESIVDTVSVEANRVDDLNDVFDKIHHKLDNAEDNAQIALVDDLRFRQLAELEKVPAMVEYADRYHNEGKAIVVFFNFNESIEAFTKLTKVKRYGLIRGKTYGDPDRKITRDAFQRNELDMIVANIKAGGESLSFHDLHGKQRVTLVSPNFSGDNLLQILGRTPRTGAKSPALQHIFFVRDSVEDKVRSRVNQKLNNLDSLLDSDLNPLV